MVSPLSPGEGRRVKTQVQLIDLPPTIIDFFGLPVPEQMEGRSLFSLLNSTEANLLPAYALSYTTRGRKSLNTEEGRALWEQKVWDQGIVLESLRSNNEWKIITGNDGRMEFYDLKEDPKETTDVKEVEQSKALDFKKRLAEESAELENYVPGQEKTELSPDTQNKLKALGYL
jgi:arylsulfatase A-like enzyme